MQLRIQTAWKVHALGAVAFAVMEADQAHVHRLSSQQVLLLALQIHHGSESDTIQ